MDTRTHAHTHAHTSNFTSHQISASQNDLHVGKGFLSVRSYYPMEVSSLHDTPITANSGCAISLQLTSPPPEPLPPNSPGSWTPRRMSEPASTWSERRSLRHEKDVLRDPPLVFWMVLSFPLRLSAGKPPPCQDPRPEADAKPHLSLGTVGPEGGLSVPPSQLLEEFPCVSH